MTERLVSKLHVALLSYDEREIRVRKNYLEEQNPAICCVCFHSGEELLRELRQQRSVDIVVLSSQLEDMDGYEFLKRLNSLHNRPLLLLQGDDWYSDATASFLRPDGRQYLPERSSLLDLLLGLHGGMLGETCILTILVGLAFLLFTRTISFAIPGSIVGTVFVLTLIATGDLHTAVAEILSGGLMFGAVFMATDYVTSPFTLKGKLIYGLCLGIVTFAIRQWGSYAEGVSFALLFMNLWVPFINDWTRQTPYGYVKPAKKAKEGAGK